MKILVTGTEGYIGSLLAPLLIQEGHEVIGLDTGFYKVGWLYNGTKVTAKTLNKDIRHITIEDLQGVEAVVHMAELSNDPLGQLAPDITYDINHKGSVHLAKLAKASGIQRFVYTSSCSVYGFATEDYVSEESIINPQTAYAKCKALVEQDVKLLADDSFSPTFLRNATAYGASGRMRFDIVLNNLAGWAWTIKEIKMNSDGTPWRPLVHLLDICKAIICTLEAPRDVIHNQIFNVGDTNSNYQVKQIAQIVAEVFTDCKLSFGKHDPDNRSYRVLFHKINQNLPGFKCEWDAQRGAQQLYNVFQQIDMDRGIFESRGFTRLKQLEYLIRTQQINQDFFWQSV
ncbi:NAD-dependent epimerase/dehydratase family protein [Nostoc sp. 'Lobaria pulmonaria (5183) cyanobiont']|uniref:NAD-dependent epimerase/dehydratase family protein n=1 Tax=Nostoc sp. 'Lobaria pulmonaria (5183) cyanobiont' TaxID=1618022 RepID=UPI000CF30310|nr:SDR family oxidoreductase [Nostoc sp. 'Lobaria pulmonaria (5183) cyanobiont']AVH69899.1 NAD-dependent epimerase/dehydratase [Nostoc sp. 'Lobaria pulmonaria (5183) cyanobiont']